MNLAQFGNIIKKQKNKKNNPESVVSLHCWFCSPAKQLPNRSVYCSKATMSLNQGKKQKQNKFVRGGGHSELLPWLRLMLELYLAHRVQQKKLQPYQSFHSRLHHCGPSSRPRRHIATTNGRNGRFHSGTDQPCTWTWLHTPTHTHTKYLHLF